MARLECWRARIIRAEAELVNAGLIARSSRFDSHLRRWFPTLVFTDANQQPRKASTGLFSRKFFRISGTLLDQGAFWIWSGRGRLKHRLTGIEVRMLLLALRDHDEQRFGGVDPTEMHVTRHGEIDLTKSSWPGTLGIDNSECPRALSRLMQAGLLTTIDVVSHFDDLHLIRYSPPADSSDEVDLHVFKVAT